MNAHYSESERKALQDSVHNTGHFMELTLRAIVRGASVHGLDLMLETVIDQAQEAVELIKRAPHDVYIAEYVREPSPFTTKESLQAPDHIPSDWLED